MTFAHPFLFAIGVAIACIGIAIQQRRALARLLAIPKYWERRPDRTLASWLLSAGLLLLAVAAGGPSISFHPAGQLTVMVDLSPSTRGAAFRDRAALLQRINQLAGNVPTRLLAFSDHVEDLPASGQLQDLPCDQTRYDSPSADAVLLFSDGRFELPDKACSTFPVIDAQLIHPADAAVSEMHFEGSSANASVRNSDQSRQLSWSGTSNDQPIPIAANSSVISGGEAKSALVQARLNGGDLWPENNSLTLPALPPERLEQWWIGAGSPPGDQGWTSDQPAGLPADPVQYLSTGLIALSNVSANELSATQQQRLVQYVRDLGGTLFIFGGDHAFASGGYSGGELDAVSPLASDPPSPATHWILLADSSGSMAESFKGESRWTAAVGAMVHLLRALPAKDIVSVGSFARDLSWWVDGEPAGTVANSAAPPAEISPNGPTNLEPALARIAQRSDPLPCELLLLTDADTTIRDPKTLAASLKAAKVRVSLLALARVAPDNPAVQIVNATGGHWIANDDPSRWVASLEQLMRSASPSLFETSIISLQFDSSLALPARPLDGWNRTWIKSDATQLAGTRDGNQTVPLAANWHLGLGAVAATAFVPTADEVRALSKTFQQPPRDPQFNVRWQSDSTISVSVDASNETSYINGLHFNLKVGEQPPKALPQTGPGEYGLSMPAVRQPSLATLELDGHVIDRRAIAGRYAPEFDTIGNDDSALAELANRTGGSVIAPTQRTPIAFHWPVRLVRIDRYLAAAGAILMAAGTLMARRIGGR